MYIVLWNGDFNLVSLGCFVQPSWPETEIFPSAARAEKGVLKGDQWGLNLLMLNISRCFSPPFLPGFFGPMLHQLRVASANAQTLKIHIDAKWKPNPSERLQKDHISFTFIHSCFMLPCHFPHAQMPLEVFCLESGICLWPQPWAFERVRSENALREGNCKHIYRRTVSHCHLHPQTNYHNRRRGISFPHISVKFSVKWFSDQNGSLNTEKKCNSCLKKRKPESLA